MLLNRHNAAAATRCGSRGRPTSSAACSHRSQPTAGSIRATAAGAIRATAASPIRAAASPISSKPVPTATADDCQQQCGWIPLGDNLPCGPPSTVVLCTEVHVGDVPGVRRVLGDSGGHRTDCVIDVTAFICVGHGARISRVIYCHVRGRNPRNSQWVLSWLLAPGMRTNLLPKARCHVRNTSVCHQGPARDDCRVLGRCCSLALHDAKLELPVYFHHVHASVTALHRDVLPGIVFGVPLRQRHAAASQRASAADPDTGADAASAPARSSTHAQSSATCRPTTTPRAGRQARGRVTVVQQYIRRDCVAHPALWHVPARSVAKHSQDLVFLP